MHAFRFIAVIASAALAAGTAALLCSPLPAAETAPADPKAQAGTIKVVIVVGGHPYDEKNFDKAWGGHEDIQCEVWKGKPYALFDKIDDFKYDVVMFYNLSGGITDPQKANFLKLLEKGVGVVVWHHALANCQEWPEFEKIAGGKFWMAPGERDGKKVPASGTGWGDIKMHVADPNHPITKGMEDYVLADETYNKQTFLDGIHVLISTKDPRSDKSVAWTHKYSNAKVFACQSGHDAKAWTNPAFRRLLANGIRWVAGRLGGK